MVKQYHFAILSDRHFDLVKITNQIREKVEESGVQTGVVFAITEHTTTGITVNENLDCLESDIETLLRKLVEDDAEYVHGHWLPSYGRTSANPTGHLRSLLTGNHCVFPVSGGTIHVGAAQDVYLCEYDGPQQRDITVVVMGE